MEEGGTVSYERLVNLGNYENERIGVTLRRVPGETYTDAWQRAFDLVEEEIRRRAFARNAPRVAQTESDIPF